MGLFCSLLRGASSLGAHACRRHGGAVRFASISRSLSLVFGAIFRSLLTRLHYSIYTEALVAHNSTGPPQEGTGEGTGGGERGLGGGGERDKLSMYVGVSWSKQKSKWRVRAGKVHVGFFEDEHEAAQARHRYLLKTTPTSQTSPVGEMEVEQEALDQRGGVGAEGGGSRRADLHAGHCFVCLQTPRQSVSESGELFQGAREPQGAPDKGQGGGRPGGGLGVGALAHKKKELELVACEAKLQRMHADMSKQRLKRLCTLLAGTRPASTARSSPTSPASPAATLTPTPTPFTPTPLTPTPTPSPAPTPAPTAPPPSIPAKILPKRGGSAARRGRIADGRGRDTVVPLRECISKLTLRRCMSKTLQLHKLSCSWKCEHGRQRSMCVPCGGKGICPHQRRRWTCPVCRPESFCGHGRKKSRCTLCPDGGKELCKHKRRSGTCIECGSTRYLCPHLRQPSRCAECGGKGLCEHKRRRRLCRICTPSMYTPAAS